MDRHRYSFAVVVSLSILYYNTDIDSVHIAIVNIAILPILLSILYYSIDIDMIQYFHILAI